MAHQKNVRYVDEDMNRCFYTHELQDQDKTSLNTERRRAMEINQLVGPKGHSNTDFVIDLHNTTSNSGVMLCCKCGGSTMYCFLRWLTIPVYTISLISNSSSSSPNLFYSLKPLL